MNRRVYTSITTEPSGYEAGSTHHETDRRSKDCPWCVRKESQPGGTRGFRVSAVKVLRQDPGYDVSINIDTERMCGLLGNSLIAESGDLLVDFRSS